jgi:hydrogenase maturation protein HypF
MTAAYSIQVRGVVQGVGFRPFVYRLARANGLAGWVLNTEDGVEIHLEGDEKNLQSFLDRLRTVPPPTAAIASIQHSSVEPSGFADFAIRSSSDHHQPTARISPDLAICDQCVAELFNPLDRRFHYPYTNCMNCGPRYSVIRKLPYDRANTTMAGWPLDPYCASEYDDPSNRRFHAQPVACPQCGPQYMLRWDGNVLEGDERVISESAEYLRQGKILAVKGLGGYHLACDAQNVETVAALRTRKYRKEKPFALMVKNAAAARDIVCLSTEAETLLTSAARPIVLAPAVRDLPGVAPDNDELGVMLPYTPLHHLLFAAGAPPILVMTSANRSSEPIAYRDEDALASLSGIADAFLVGERPIARRMDDSVVRSGAFGASILRRARGYAPAVVASLPSDQPVLALGADLKNTITLVVDGQAFVSQHIGDLDHYEALRAFDETVQDLLSMYRVDRKQLLVLHDAHPQYLSTAHAWKLDPKARCAVQHHRAHVASAIAERGAWDKRVIGVSFDGTGYGDDGTIWGGEFFLGSVGSGFERVAHLRRSSLPGGDASAAYPPQAAAGFLAQLEGVPDLAAPPFSFPARYLDAAQMVRKGVRTFITTSMGRLFDAVAALLGFTREITFEGQAAMWLERLARRAASSDPYPLPFVNAQLDFRPLLASVIEDRLRGRAVAEIARAFHLAVAVAVTTTVRTLSERHNTNTVVLSGGVFQNELLLSILKDSLGESDLEIWTNREVPTNDGGISLGQAAIGIFANTDLVRSDSYDDSTSRGARPMIALASATNVHQ